MVAVSHDDQWRALAVSRPVVAVVMAGGATADGATAGGATAGGATTGGVIALRPGHATVDSDRAPSCVDLEYTH